MSLIREILFGAQDGLIVPLGVASSVAGAFTNSHIVIIACIAEALAGAFSMGTGAYLSSQAERQVQEAEIARERDQLRRHPEVERTELEVMFKLEKLSEHEAKNATRSIGHSSSSFLNTMVQKEFGIDPRPLSSPITDGVYMGISYLCAAIIPIMPYFLLPAHMATLPSIVMTLCALFLLGVLKAQFAQLSPLRSGLYVLGIGALSGIGGYFLGKILPRLLGSLNQLNNDTNLRLTFV